MDSKQHTYRTFIIVISGCLLFGLSLGIRMNYGILLNAYTNNANLQYNEMSLVIAVGELIYGIAQPFFGIIAIKRSHEFVLKIGLCLFIIGFISSAFIRSTFLLIITLGIILSAGTGAICFGIVMGTISPYIPKEKSAIISGLVNSSSGIGSSIMSPFMEYLIKSFGLTNTMLILSIPAFLLMSLVYWIKKEKNHKADNKENIDCETSFSSKQILKKAMHLRTYQYLIIGFTTCGFHMSLIQNHFYSQIISYGISSQLSAFAYTTFGIGTMVGAFISGLLCSKFHLKNVLTSLYLLRAIIIMLFFLIMPKNIISVIIFAIVLGLCGDATVTPTSEIINLQFGTIHMAFLFGIVFMCHQLGAFISTWLAGILLNATGSYSFIWIIDLILCIIASVASYQINVTEYEYYNQNIIN